MSAKWIKAGEEWLDKNLDTIFAPSKSKELTIHCTLDSLMRLTGITKNQALNIIKTCGTPLEHEGWYEITLKE